MKKHSTSENLFGGTVEGLFTGSASPDTHFGKLLRIGKKNRYETSKSSQSCNSGRSALEQLTGPLCFCAVCILHCLVQLMAQVSRLCVFALCVSQFHMA